MDGGVCGADRGVTMVSELERGQPGRLPEQQAASLIEEYHFALLQSFSEVFGMDLIIESESSLLEVA
jgi:hypothetical protein